MIRLRKATVWAGSIALAVAFVAIGISKLGGASAIRWGERFGHWGYPTNTHYVVGVLEVLCGLGVLIPRWRRAASLTLIALMVGALWTHVVDAEFSRVFPPLVLGGFAFLIYWSHSRPTGQ